MITKFIIFENNKERFIPGEMCYNIPFKKMYKIVEVTDNETIWIEDEDGNQGEFLIKDFIPEIEFNANRYNL